MLNAALIGFGGIAKSHRKAYAGLKAAGKMQLVAAYDIDPEAFTKNVSINIDSGDDKLEESINFYEDLDEMLAKEKIDVIDICIPTFMHGKMSIDMLRRGYHVMCEKPMSLTYSECEEMIRASKESSKELMIGQCLRFYPAFDYVKRAMELGEYGEFLGAHFQRISPPPVWGWENWFMCPERSGGCMTDLHIHDVDIIRYLFGEPKEISCVASTSLSIYDTVHSCFYYGSSPVTAIGDWTLSGVPFSAIARLNFEKATLVIDVHTLSVYPKDGSKCYTVPIDPYNPQELELSYFHDVITGRIANTKNTPESAAVSVKLVEHLRESAKNNGARKEFLA